MVDGVAKSVNSLQFISCYEWLFTLWDAILVHWSEKIYQMIVYKSQAGNSTVFNYYADENCIGLNIIIRAIKQALYRWVLDIARIYYDSGGQEGWYRWKVWDVLEGLKLRNAECMFGRVADVSAGVWPATWPDFDCLTPYVKKFLLATV